MRRLRLSYMEIMSSRKTGIFNRDLCKYINDCCPGEECSKQFNRLNWRLEPVPYAGSNVIDTRRNGDYFRFEKKSGGCFQ